MSRFSWVASFTLLPVVALAQQAGSTSGPQTTLHVSVHQVYVDVIARDSHGNVMRGLTQQDFKVLEDGHPVPIDFFTAHVPAPPNASPLSKTEFTNANGSTVRPMTMVLFDMLNTPLDDQLTGRQQMLKFLSAMPPGEHITVFALTNRLEMTQGITGSPSLTKAVSKMLRPSPSSLVASRTESMMDNQVGANFNAQGRAGLGTTATANMGSRSDYENYEARARSTIDVLGEIAKGMADYPGRKSLYWVSESFPLSIDRVGGPVNSSNTSASAAQFDQRLIALQGHFSQTSRQEAQVSLNRLAAARIAVYPTSVFGLTTQASSAAVTASTEFSGNPGDPSGGFFALNNLKSEMNDLARETGGEVIFGTNDIAGAMERARNDAATYYTLVYKPSNKEWKGEFRQIKVEAVASGSLIYRRGYFATPDVAVADSSNDLNRAMQPGVQEETSLRLRSKILPADPEHPGLLVESTITTDDISFTTTPDGHHHARIFVQLVAFNDEGEQPKSIPHVSGTLNIDLDPQRYEFIRSAGIAFRQQLALKPGKYGVVLGVNDESSHKLGTLEMPVVIPAS